MRKRDAIGRRIVSICQHRTTTNYGTPAWCVDSITLDNGTVLIPSVSELEDGYTIELTAHRPERNRE